MFDLSQFKKIIGEKLKRPAEACRIRCGALIQRLRIAMAG